MTSSSQNSEQDNKTVIKINPHPKNYQIRIFIFLLVLFGAILLVSFSFNFQTKLNLRKQQYQYQQLIHEIQSLNDKESVRFVVESFEETDNSLVKRHLEEQNSQNKSQQPKITKYVLIMIIAFFVAVPILALLIFGVIFCVQRCTHYDQNSTQNPIQSEIKLNLEQFNIDQIGPYHTNPNDQCSICLDNRTNIRTFCGHFFHAQCLKTWFDKKNKDKQSPTCPVCIGEITNPVKAYCKTCFVSGKLDIIYITTPQQKIDELDSYRCSQCRQVGTNQSDKQKRKKQKCSSNSSISEVQVVDSAVVINVGFI